MQTRCIVQGEAQWKKLGPVLNTTLGPVLTQKPPNLGPALNSTASTNAVELKISPILAFHKLKTGPFLFLFVFENLVFPAERRGLFKNKPKQQPPKNTF